jgi:hypothetical protein
MGPIGQVDQEKKSRKQIFFLHKCCLQVIHSQNPEKSAICGILRCFGSFGKDEIVIEKAMYFD